MSDLFFKITRENQPCRKCKTPVVRKSHKPGWKPPTSFNRSYWFRWWFACPKCRTIYFDDSAKVLLAAGEIREQRRLWDRERVALDEEYRLRLERED